MPRENSRVQVEVLRRKVSRRKESAMSRSHAAKTGKRARQASAARVEHVFSGVKRLWGFNKVPSVSVCPTVADEARFELPCRPPRARPVSEVPSEA